MHTFHFVVVILVFIAAQRISYKNAKNAKHNSSRNASYASKKGGITKIPGSGEFFDDIAIRYDVLNQVISLGLHGSWRTSAISKILPADSVLDVSTGTGDLAIAIAANRSVRVVAIDPSQEMLKIARIKAHRFAPVIGKVHFVTGVAEALPFESDTFHSVVSAFGVRNFQDREKGLSEMVRVLKPQGKMAVLEAAVAETDFLLDRMHRFFVTQVMPRLAGVITGNPLAYQYLGDSMQKFPHEKEFRRILEQAGLVVESYERLPPFGLGPFLYCGYKASVDNHDK